MSSNTKPTAALVPKLRFPEFQSAGNWTTKKLGALATISTEKVGTNSCVPMSITSGVGLVSQEDKFGRVIAGDSYKNYLLLKPNDFAYNKSATKEYPEGFLTLYSGTKLAAVPNSIFTCFRINGDSPDARFLNYQFADNVHGRWLRQFIQVGARAHGSLSINDNDLMALPVPVPAGMTSVDEQQKIAACLSSVDELIAAQARKVDALKTHKKGLMQQLFPREGEIQPRLRFPEFKDAGEWEQCRFDKVFDRLKTKNTTNEQNVLTISAQDGLVSQLEYFNKSISSKDISGYQLLNRGDFAYNKSYSQGYPWGAIKPLKRYGVGVVSPLYICFRLRDSLSHIGSFFEQYFDAGCLDVELKKIAQEGARNHGMLNIGIVDFFDLIRLWIPHLAEQQRIASCLSTLDDLITAEAQKLEALKTHKKGLMQQLFPSPEAVEA